MNRRLLFECLEGRRLLAADLLARFEFTNAVGEAQPSLQVGQDFQLNLYIQDNRGTPQGVFQAYFDVDYDANLLSTTGDISFGSAYSAAGLTAGDTLTDGLINDAGGRDTDQFRPTPRDAELLLFSAPFHADAAGTLALGLGLADRPDRSIQFFDTVSGLPIERIDFSGGVIEIAEAGILVTPTANLTTSETGDTDTFQVVLTSVPTATVTVGLSSTDTTEGTVSPGSLVFNSSNWDTPQTVTVFGVDDFSVDGPVGYTIVTSEAVSDDPRFDELDPDDVSVTNSDDDLADLSIVETDETTEVSEDETSDSFDVALTAQPSSNVVVRITGVDTSEATIDRSSLTFTPGNWNTTQRVTVVGVDDDLIDDNQFTTITLAIDDDASDDVFDSMLDRTVTVTTTDNGDAAGLEITETSSSTEVSESGTVDTVNVRLRAQPDSDVVISVSASDLSEATVSTGELTFTSSNWNVFQAVDVTGVDDHKIDGDVTSTTEFTVDDAKSDDHFDALADRFVTVVTHDDGDTAGFDVTQAGDVTLVSESGTTDTFDVVLTAEPDTNVVLLVATSDPSEIALDRTSLTFTPTNWNVAQTVTGTGVDDSSIDGSQISSITLSIDDDNSDDHFDPLLDHVIQVTTVDNDSAGFTIAKTDESTEVSESGTTDTFDVVLTARPDTNVVITVSVDDTTEASLDTSSLVFTPDAWDTPQTVTVTGVDDWLIDQDQTSLITLSIDDASSDDHFDPLADQAVTVTTTDDGDIAGFTITESDDQTEVSEAQTTDTFNVSLSAQPFSDVTIQVVVSDPSEIMVDAVSLVFTPEAWNISQTVNVSGVDDSLVDGNRVSTITLRVDDEGSDDNFDPLPDQVIQATTLDDDVAGFTVTETDGFTEVSESGTSDTFDVVLTAQPDADVVLSVIANDTSEVDLDVGLLTFTSSNWNAPQTVTVTGVDDALLDDDQVSGITLSVVEESSDDNFDAIAPHVVSATTTDDGDVAGFIVTPTGATTEVSETGTSDTFDVVLTAKPDSDVVISITNDDPTETALDKPSLTFTSGNWDVVQTVTVTGVDDFLIDGDQTSEVLVSVDDANSDDNFDSVADESIAVTTSDDGDAAGFTVDGIGATKVVSESGTTETFQLVLTTRPDVDVRILVTVSDASEVDVDKVALTFIPTSWNVPQVVTVTGVDDFLIDGNQFSMITLTVDDANSDDNFDSLADQTIDVMTADDGDMAGFIATQTNGLTTVAETRTTDAIEVVLTAQPDTPVVILATGNDPSEAQLDVASLRFTPSTWDTPQVITVTGVDDNLIDGDIFSAISLVIDDENSDDNFDNVSDQILSVTTQDAGDVAGLRVIETAGSTHVSESGTTDVFEVALTAEPNSNVVVLVSSSDTGEVTADVLALTFEPANWNVPQPITVTGVDDVDTDGDQVSAITLSVDDPNSDGNFAVIADVDVSVSTVDDDTPGILVTPLSGLVTDESGGTANFEIVLKQQPTAEVTVDLDSSNPTEVTLSHASVTFTVQNWNTPQLITVTGVDDFVIDGSAGYTIVTSLASSADLNYHEMDVEDVSGVNNDDDVADIQLIESGGETEVSEAGTADTFDVRLTAQPASDVVIAVSSSDLGEATVDISELTFTPANWNESQTITVSGVDDPLIDGDQAFSVNLSVVAERSDDDFDAVPTRFVTVTTLDSGDAAGFAVTHTDLETVVSESGTTDTFDVVLSAQPVTMVVILVSAEATGELTLDKTSLTFDPENWSMPQTITATGVDDDLIDGDQSSTVLLAIDADASDDNFDTVVDQTAVVTTVDDDIAGFMVTETGEGTEVSESGTSDTLSVTLTAEPDSDVVVNVINDDATELAVDANSLTFTPENWNVPQLVTVTGVDDPLIDGDQMVPITFSIDDGSSDDNFDAVVEQAIQAVVTDFDDFAGIDIIQSDDETRVSELGTTDTYQLKLKAQPFSDVVVKVASGDTGEAVVDKETLTFTPENWNVAQTVTVTGVDDALIDGPQTTTVTISIDADNSDDNFDAVADLVPTVTTDDDDVAGFAITTTGENTQVSESGTTDTLDVVLTAEPFFDVIIRVDVGDPGEASLDATFLTFTPANWNVPQTITVVGVDDDLIDGDQSSTLLLAIDAEASDDNFDTVVDQTATVTTVDDDVAGFLVTETGGDTEVSESGTTDTFAVQLTAQPATNVVIMVSSTDLSEVTVSPASLTFTPENWSSPQTVTVTGVDDPLIDGEQTTAVVLSIDDANSDDSFDDVVDQSVQVVTTDVELIDFLVTETDGGTEVSESGTTDTFTVVLTVQPIADVVISVQRSDSGTPDEAVVSPQRLTFTSENWTLAQNVTVTGIDDALIDGTQLTDFTLSIVDAESDDHFDDVADQTVTVATTDGDVAGLALTETDGDTRVSETGTTDQVSVALTAQPDSDVVIAVATDDAGEVISDVSTLTFSPNDWNTPQVITLTGVDDGFVDGDTVSALQLSIVDSASDDNFDGVLDQSIAVTTTDDNLAELRIAVRQASQDEGQTGVTTNYAFDVTLSGAVEGGFTVGFETSDDSAVSAAGDYVANSGTLNFAGTDSENEVITVVVDGDDVVEIDETFVVSLGALTNVSASAMDRISIVVDSATATIRNDDSADLTIADIVIAEGTGGTPTSFTFQVTLSHAVQGGFEISYDSIDGTATTVAGDYTDTTGTLSFQGIANEIQTITVLVASDSQVERDEQFSLTLGTPSQFADPSLADDVTVSDASATGVIQNDDTATVSFVDATSSVIEASGTHTIQVVLNLGSDGTLSEDVIVAVDVTGGTAQSPADFTLEDTSVTFPADSEDGATQSIEVTIVEDAVAEDNDETVDLRLAVSGDGIGGAVSVGVSDEHEITITDDSMDASLSGFVWADADNDGQRDVDGTESAVEVGVPGVRVTLTGTTRLGESIELVAMTGPDGAYRFDDLPVGTYELQEEQPQAFLDGQEQTDAEGAQVDDDHISQIELLPGQAFTENIFYERGFRSEYVSIRLLLASTPPSSVVLREWNIMAAENNDQLELAEGIRDSNPPASVSPEESGSNSLGPQATGGGEGEGLLLLDESEGEGEGPFASALLLDRDDETLVLAPRSSDLPGDSESSSVWSAGEVDAFAPAADDNALAQRTKSWREIEAPVSDNLPWQSDEADLADTLFSDQQDWLDGLGLV